MVTDPKRLVDFFKGNVYVTSVTKDFFVRPATATAPPPLTATAT